MFVMLTLKDTLSTKTMDFACETVIHNWLISMHWALSIIHLFCYISLLFFAFILGLLFLLFHCPTFITMFYPSLTRIAWISYDFLICYAFYILFRAINFHLYRIYRSLHSFLTLLISFFLCFLQLINTFLVKISLRLTFLAL